MLVVGPALMGVVFGGDFDYERGGLVLVSLAMGLYLSAATLNQALLAQGRARQAARVLGRVGRRVRRVPAAVAGGRPGAVGGGRAARRPRRACAPSSTRCTVAPESRGRVRGDPRAASTGRPASANGGYTCGVVARCSAPTWRRSRCARRRRSGGRSSVTHHGRPGGAPRRRDARGRGRALRAAARRARAGAPRRRPRRRPRPARPHGRPRTPFPPAWSAAPTAAPGDGYRIFPGPVPGRDGLYAATWTPDPSLAGDDGHVRPECLWGALDCPTSAPVANFGEGPPVVLARLTARLGCAVRAGERHALVLLAARAWTAASATRLRAVRRGRAAALRLAGAVDRAARAARGSDALALTYSLYVGCRMSRVSDRRVHHRTCPVLRGHLRPRGHDGRRSGRPRSAATATTCSAAASSAPRRTGSRSCTRTPTG